MIELAFDIDGVLTDSWTIFRDELQKKTGVFIPQEEPRTFLLEKILDISSEEVWKCARSYIKRWDEIQPTRGCLEFLTWYYSQVGGTIKVITSRPESLREETEKWFDKYFEKGTFEVYYADYYCEKKTTKYSIMESLGIEIIVEDRMKYAKEISKQGGGVWLVDKPYNNFYIDYYQSDIIRVSGWSEIKMLLETLNQIFLGDS